MSALDAELADTGATPSPSLPSTFATTTKDAAPVQSSSGTVLGGGDPANNLGNNHPIPPPKASDSGGGGTGSRVVTFYKTGHVFDALTERPADGNFEIDFGLANKTVIVQSLTVFVDVPSGPEQGLVKVVSAAASDRQGQLFQDSQNGTSRHARLNLDEFRANSSDYFGSVMILAVNWTVDATTGYTYSPAFSIVESPQDADQVRPLLADSKYAASRETTIFSDSSSNGGDSTHGGIPPPMHTGSNNGTSNLTVDGSSHGGGGLSTGAIVGIAVGVGVAALLAAALGVFFFLRRRKNKTASSAAARNQAAEQEKLSSFPKDVGSGNASDPALTPYHDESSAARGLHHDENGALERPPRVPSETGSGATTPHGVSRHLVEDGMTEAEIQRLEEEEAHLDSEIQRAGGRR